MTSNVILKKEEVIEVSVEKPVSYEDRLKELEIKMKSIAQMFYMFKRTGMPKKAKKIVGNNKNAEGLDLNSCFIGYVANSNYPYVLIVNDEGLYNIGEKEFKSLKEATNSVFGDNADGQSLWQTLDGVFIKDLI